MKPRIRVSRSETIALCGEAEVAGTSDTPCPGRGPDSGRRACHHLRWLPARRDNIRQSLRPFAPPRTDPDVAAAGAFCNFSALNEPHGIPLDGIHGRHYS